MHVKLQETLIQILRLPQSMPTAGASSVTGRPLPAYGPKARVQQLQMQAIQMRQTRCRRERISHQIAAP